MTLSLDAASSVPVEEIDHQRSLGWPDFHPEDYCHRCGNRNVECWFAPQDTWTEALPLIGRQWAHIICPQCFTKLHEKATGRQEIWEIRKWVDPNPLAKEKE